MVQPALLRARRHKWGTACWRLLHAVRRQRSVGTAGLDVMLGHAVPCSAVACAFVNGCPAPHELHASCASPAAVQLSLSCCRWLLQWCGVAGGPSAAAAGIARGSAVGIDAAPRPAPPTGKVEGWDG